MPVKLSTKYLDPFINCEDYEKIRPAVSSAHNFLHQKTGLGSEFTGWVTLPTDYNKEEFLKIKETAKKINSRVYSHKKMTDEEVYDIIDI